MKIEDKILEYIGKNKKCTLEEIIAHFTNLKKSEILTKLLMLSSSNRINFTEKWEIELGDNKTPFIDF